MKRVLLAVLIGVVAAAVVFGDVAYLWRLLHQHHTTIVHHKVVVHKRTVIHESRAGSSTSAAHTSSGSTPARRKSGPAKPSGGGGSSGSGPGGGGTGKPKPPVGVTSPIPVNGCVLKIVCLS